MMTPVGSSDVAGGSVMVVGSVSSLLSGVVLVMLLQSTASLAVAASILTSMGTGSAVISHYLLSVFFLSDECDY
eukprot:scaffold128725_cov62-Attheya_sp.AAC.3